MVKRRERCDQTSARAWSDHPSFFVLTPLSLGRALALFERVTIADQCSSRFPVLSMASSSSIRIPVVRALEVGAKLDFY